MSETVRHGNDAGPGVGDYIHVAASLIALGLGGLMYFYPWALHGFAVLMIISAVSAVIISWRTDSWVTGHYLAMAPVLGVGAGYLGVPGGFTFAYVCLWLAFGHFVRRGLEASRQES